MNYRRLSVFISNSLKQLATALSDALEYVYTSSRGGGNSKAENNIIGLCTIAEAGGGKISGVFVPIERQFKRVNFFRYSNVP